MEEGKPTEIKRKKEYVKDDLKDFSTKIYNLRMEHGYTLRDLENISRNVYHDYVSKGGWSKYERGISEPGLTKLRMISNIYGVTLDYLVGLTDDPHGNYRGSNVDKKLSHTQTVVLDAYEKADEEKKKTVNYILKIRPTNKKESDPE